MRITQHFDSSSFASHDGIEVPPEYLHSRLYTLCSMLEVLRADLGGRRIEIVSGYRSPAWNKHVKGAEHSQHLEARAADLTVEGMDPADVYLAAMGLYRDGRLPALGGAGLYPPGPTTGAGWIHLDVRPRINGHLAMWTGKQIGDEATA